MNIDWLALLKYVGSFLMAGGIFKAITDAIRHRKEDAAKAILTAAEAEKVNAEAEKVNAESTLLHVQSGERIFDTSMKMVDWLSKENDRTKKELDSAWGLIHELRSALEKMTQKATELEESLLRERESNRTCRVEIEQLRVELARYKRDAEGRP
jgi:chromosome segregation ATPase